MAFEVYHGDCVEVMERLAETGRVFDAVVADPPYCSGGITPARRTGDETKYTSSNRKGSVYYQKNGSFNDSMMTDAFYYFSRVWMMRAREIMTDPGYMFVFTDWRMLNVIGNAMQSAGLIQRGIITWEKGNARPNRGQFSPTTEFIVWGTSTAGKSNKYVSKSTITCPPPQAADRTHPTEKPPEVYSVLFKILDDEAAAVLDPFSGSGAAGIAALDAGLDYVGIDNLEEYATKTRERLGKFESLKNGA